MSIAYNSIADTRDYTTL